MTIPAAPTTPNPNSTTFADDAYAFTQWMATVGPAMDAEIARINSIANGSYTATSTTSLTIGTGVTALTITTGKSFGIGQAVVLAQTMSPTNYMTGQVTAHDSTTGAMTVNVTAFNGSGTAAAWTVSVGALVAGGGVGPDSIVVLTSGASWTCPAGVTKAFARVQGAGGSGSSGATNQIGGPGAAGGYAEKLFTLTPGAAYTYAIGAAGTAVNGAGITGNPGGTTTITVGATTVTSTGGAGGRSSLMHAVGGTASGGDLNIAGMNGNNQASASYYRGYQPQGVLGSYGCGGYGEVSANPSGAGGPGVIILELYK